MTVTSVRGVPPSSRWRHTAYVSFTLWCAVALYAVAAPLSLRAQGEQLVTLVSGSMAPIYPTGSVLVLEPTDAAHEVRVGDVITAAVGSGLPLTHRVVERVDLPSRTAFRTQGDANNAADDRLVQPAQVLGRIAGPLPRWLSVAVELQEHWWRLLLFGVPLLVILLYEVGDLRRRLRSR